MATGLLVDPHAEQSGEIVKAKALLWTGARPDRTNRARSGWLVMMPSTPTATADARSSMESTVHAKTRPCVNCSFCTAGADNEECRTEMPEKPSPTFWMSSFSSHPAPELRDMYISGSDGIEALNSCKYG